MAAAAAAAARVSSGGGEDEAARNARLRQAIMGDLPSAGGRESAAGGAAADGLLPLGGSPSTSFTRCLYLTPDVSLHVNCVWYIVSCSAWVVLHTRCGPTPRYAWRVGGCADSGLALLVNAAAALSIPQRLDGWRKCP